MVGFLLTVAWTRRQGARMLVAVAYQVEKQLRALQGGAGLREGFEQGAMIFTRFQGGNTKHAHGTGRRATPDGPTRLAKQFTGLTANMNRRQPQLSFLYEPTEFFSRRMRNGDDNVTAAKRFHVLSVIFRRLRANQLRM